MKLARSLGQQVIMPICSSGLLLLGRVCSVIRGIKQCFPSFQNNELILALPLYLVIKLMREGHGVVFFAPWRHVTRPVKINIARLWMNNMANVAEANGLLRHDTLLDLSKRQFRMLRHIVVRSFQCNLSEPTGPRSSWRGQS